MPTRSRTEATRKRAADGYAALAGKVLQGHAVFDACARAMHEAAASAALLATAQLAGAMPGFG